jgi:hypothetical protein
MIRSNYSALSSLPRATVLAMALGLSLCATAARASDFPITAQQRDTAQKTAQAGVALSELVPNAPDSYTVKSGDTLWDISKLFLKTPWRWPELWGMNLDQIRNPHLIYPGQVLFLDKADGRARLRVGNEMSPDGSGRLSPRARASDLDRGGIPSISMAQIEPFLNEAVIFEAGEVATAPRVVAPRDGRVLMGSGDLAYVRGDTKGLRKFRLFREPRPLRDPATKEILGYEGIFLGTAEFTRKGETVGISKAGEIVPDTFTITSVRQEVRAGDRLSPTPPREYVNHVPRAPQGDVSGLVVSLYGDALTGGQNQIVAINRGQRDGMESGHVLALWRTGARIVDRTDKTNPTIKLPDERNGSLFVFRVFGRMSYALILTASEPVTAGDRVTQP